MNNKTAQYQYSHVDMETVVQNPNEYIIPPCQLACKALWDKNIETFMVSNYEDDNLYILLGKLDENNQQIMNEAVRLNPHFFISEYRKSFGIKVAWQDITATRKLLELTELFEMQDTFRYKSPEEFLTDFKRKGSNSYELLPDGAILIKENPDTASVTFEEALAKTGKQDLYIASENRVYDSPMYLEWHQRYQEYTKEINQGRNK